jgi:hypothetical protein
MTLPPKAIGVLIDIKKELLSQSVMITSDSQVPVVPVLDRSNVMITRRPTQFMRHARVRGFAVQRMYQRGEL